MGLFLTASAFRTTDTEAVRGAALAFFAELGWPAEVVPADDTEDDVRVYPAEHGWTVVLWPEYFFEEPAVESISRALGVVTSAVHVYAGDYWVHTLLRDGEVLDRFASVPGYFSDDPDLPLRYAGNAALIAEVTGARAADLEPYLIHLGDDDDELGPAFPDDEFDLTDVWVFADFWRRVGPRYPDDIVGHAAQVRLAPGWQDKLPTGESEL